MSTVFNKFHYLCNGLLCFVFVLKHCLLCILWLVQISSLRIKWKLIVMSHYYDPWEKFLNCSWTYSWTISWMCIWTSSWMCMNNKWDFFSFMDNSWIDIFMNVNEHIFMNMFMNILIHELSVNEKKSHLLFMHIHELVHEYVHEQFMNYSWNSRRGIVPGELHQY